MTFYQVHVVGSRDTISYNIISAVPDVLKYTVIALSEYNQKVQYRRLLHTIVARMWQSILINAGTIPVNITVLYNRLVLGIS